MDLPTGKEPLEAALEGLTRLNVVIMQHVRIPRLYQAGIRWKLEQGRQRWRRADEILAQGHTADCKNLAAWRAAELRVSGEDPAARVVVHRTSEHMWHAQVMRGNGTIEDPSRVLGMGQHRHHHVTERVMAEFTGSEYVGADPSDSLECTFTTERIPAGWRATLRVPLDGLRQAKALFVHREHASKAGAQNAALKAASKVLDDPRVAALIPPPAKFALNLIRSPGARKIAAGLAHLF